MVNVAIVFGAGSNIGSSLVKKFLSEGFKVATVSRKDKFHITDENHSHLKGDLTKPSTVSDIFEKVREKFGEPNLVVYNAFGFSLAPADDVLNEDVSVFEDNFRANTTSFYVAAKEAVRSFEKSTEKNKTFIYTGNILNLKPINPLLTLGVGKTASYHILELAQQSYGEKGYKFYYADERTSEGGNVSYVDGGAAAEFYSSLADGSAGDVPVEATFVKDKGLENTDDDSGVEPIMLVGNYKNLKVQVVATQIGKLILHSTHPKNIILSIGSKWFGKGDETDDDDFNRLMFVLDKVKELIQ